MKMKKIEIKSNMTELSALLDFLIALGFDVKNLTTWDGVKLKREVLNVIDEFNTSS
jgi:hypothetical protein